MTDCGPSVPNVTDLVQVWLGTIPMSAMTDPDSAFLRACIKSARDLGIPAELVQEEYDRLRQAVQERTPKSIPTYEELAE